MVAGRNYQCYRRVCIVQAHHGLGKELLYGCRRLGCMVQVSAHQEDIGFFPVGQIDQLVEQGGLFLRAIEVVESVAQVPVAGM